MLTPELLQNIAIARLALGVSVILLLFFAFKVRRQSVWALGIGLTWAFGAATLLFPAHTLLWGNQGDETFQIAFMERVISGNPFSDFFYANLAPFYPPLYFWIFGTLGRIFNWDGISAAQWGTCITYALLPIVALGFAKLCLWNKRESLTTLLLTIGTLTLLPTEALLLKPYETAAALLSVLWVVAFTKLLHEPTWKLRITLGVTGGIIFLLYYFWFILLIPAMIILIIAHQKNTKEHIISFGTIGVGVTLIASPFLIPYITNLITLGQENYQSVYFFPSDAHLYAPWLSFSLFGFVTLASIATFIKKEWSETQKATLALGASIAAWYIAQLLILSFEGKSIMLSKPFLFLGGMTLLLPLAEWIATWWETQDSSWRRNLSPRILAAAVIILTPTLPNGLFLDDTKIQTQLEQNLQPTASSYVAENITVFVPDYASRIWLTSGLQDLSGRISLTYYLAWNPHFSHPSAHWGSRLKEIKNVSELTNPTDATAAFDTLGINALLLYKATDENNQIYYPFFYEDDAWPNGTQSKEIHINPKLFSQNNWQIAHEDNEWIIVVRK
jgi:hypothetical protein